MAPMSRAFRPESCLLLLEEDLLRPNDAAWPTNARPSDRFLGGHLEVLHQIGANQRARAAEAGLAVHGHHARAALAKAQEPINVRGRRRRPVAEKEVEVLEALRERGRERVRE
jgi:hypothetical protein